MVANPNPKKFVFVLNYVLDVPDVRMLGFRLCTPRFVNQMFQRSSSAALAIVKPYQRISGELSDAQAAILLQQVGVLQGNAKTVEKLVSEAAFIAASLKHIEAHLGEPEEKRLKCLMSFMSWTPEKVNLGAHVCGHLLTKVPLGYGAPDPGERCMLVNDWLQASDKEDGIVGGRAVLGLNQNMSWW